MQDKVKIDYLPTKEYSLNNLNVVGATTNTTLRTSETISGDTYYVKKFGTDYFNASPSVSNAVINNPRSDGGGVNQWTYFIEGLYEDSNGVFTWEKLGEVQDANGASQAYNLTTDFEAHKIRIKISVDSGVATITDGDTLTLTTSTDPGGLTIQLPGEGNTYTFNSAWGEVILYLSSSGSTYYDENMMIGGKRHTPVIGSTKYPFFHPADCLADASWGANDGLIIQDSESYQIDEEEITDNGVVIQSDLGQIARFASPIGASIYRDMEHDGNNDDTVYVSNNGSDATGDGSYQNPYATHSTAFTNLGTRTYINTIDSTEYNENFTISSNCTLEPVWKQTPTITYNSAVTACLTLTAATVNIYGYIFNGKQIIKRCILHNGSAFSGTIRNCTTYNNNNDGIFIAVDTFSGTVSNCLAYNNGTDGIAIYAVDTLSGTISNCLAYNNGSRGIDIDAIDTFSGTIRNCITYNNYNNGIDTYAGSTFSGTISNCLAYNNGSYGIPLFVNSTFSGTISNCLAYNNGSYDLYRSGGVAITIDYSYYETNTGFTIGGNCVQGSDPELCSESNNILGIRSTSDAYHTDSNSNNMGCITHTLKISADNVKINGIIFEGLDSYVHGIMLTSTTDYTGLSVKWCDFQNYLGIAVDCYDDDADLDVTISNCKFDTNGQDVALAYGSNTIEECLFITPYSYAVWLDNSGHTIDHITVYGGTYGVYLDGSGLILKNSIIDSQGSYSIYSDAGITPKYSCINGPVNSNVVLDSTNITSDPLYISTSNFRLRSKERGYTIISPCLDLADDGYDMGCYLETRSLTGYSWKTYTPTFQPMNMNEVLEPRGEADFENATGNYYSWSKNEKIILPFLWNGNSASVESQLKMIRYLKMLRPTRQNELTEEQCLQRVYLLPDTRYGTGTGTVDASEKTLTDTAASYYPNDKKGWYVTIVFYEQTSGVVDATAKTISAGGPVWTTDEEIGFWFIQNNNYFYIIDNTDAVLTVSDKHSYLTDDANATIKIVKYFKVEKNSENVLYLKDDDNELIDGSYDYFIHFIMCRARQEAFKPKQAVFAYDRWETKSGYGITYEETDDKA